MDMSHPESMPPFMVPHSPHRPGSDAITIGVWPCGGAEQFESRSQFDQQHPPHKRARNVEENDNGSENIRMSVPPSNGVPINKGVSNIFFKTRICAKFRSGACRNGENCNFAHGMQDLRQPPPNWQELVGVGPRNEEDRSSGNWDDDQRIIHKMKLCKKFYNGEECPYGDRCNFLHEDPSKFRDDNGRFRESSVISIGTNVQKQQLSVGSGSGALANVAEVSKPVTSGGLDSSRGIMKLAHWKTRLCTKFEVTGNCPFGANCHFAHGQAELQFHTGQVESENAGFTMTKPLTNVANAAPPTNIASIQNVDEEGQDKKCLLNWKGPKKINRIYGDWLDDLPLVPNLANQVES